MFDKYTDSGYIRRTVDGGMAEWTKATGSQPVLGARTTERGFESRSLRPPDRRALAHNQGQYNTVSVCIGPGDFNRIGGALNEKLTAEMFDKT